MVSTVITILLWFFFVLPLAGVGLTALTFVNVGDQLAEGAGGDCYSGTGKNKKKIDCADMVTTATYLKAGIPLWIAIALTYVLYKVTG